MKKSIIYCCAIAVSVLFASQVCSAKLTQQQINLLLENDDIQIFTPSSATVKKASVSIEKSTDASQGKTIVEYDKKGLLINYYSASVIGFTTEAQSTMITTLMRTEDNKWQRKQTMGSYEIDNSTYALKGDNINITLLPSYNFDEQRQIAQHVETIENSQQLRVFFSYAKPMHNEKLNIEYKFADNGQLNSFNFENVDENLYGYTSIIKMTLSYDETQKLKEASEFSHYQFMNEPADEVTTRIVYSDFDQYGNWLKKTECFDNEQVIYKRVIEYWDPS